MGKCAAMSECDFTPVIALVAGVAANVFIVSKQVVDFPMLFQRMITRIVPQDLSFWFFVTIFLFQMHRVVYYACWSIFEEFHYLLIISMFSSMVCAIRVTTQLAFQ